MSDNPFEGYISKAEFCSMVPPNGITERTADRWASKRKGPARIRVGHTVLYPKQAVEDWLQREAERARRAFEACNGR